ncbi:2-oxoisovalerate dehydrogenase E2 component [Klebsormidium nitens]|uniref:Dihydrolipoamide acetyltransferase component of pyruvate dehydrogenase complex n=1 Tax=Klebsormidium nitens TaxID=105231 RepID=A0A1Y1IFW1_KLENI|nr:2-oxoisovalerate dehydrogenase E2 component [Klebsormidium nitens]|eukprot:GAQ89523.1 2-oxoisovalerate dehydrogenase E2 component [Klebsormidium nitens]
MHALRWQLTRFRVGLRSATVCVETQSNPSAWRIVSEEANHKQSVRLLSSLTEAPRQRFLLLESWTTAQRCTSWDNLWHERREFSAPASKPGLNKDGVYDILLAQTGEGIAECEVLKWNVKEGQEVQQFDLLCEVQSDKASVEITSRYAGTVRKIYFQPGDIVKVGETLCDLTPLGGQPEPATSSEEPALAAAHKASASEPVTASVISEHAPKAGTGGHGPKHKASASPAVRALAREYGVDLSNVVGTGPEGRVLKGDVLRFVAVSQGVEETREAGGVSDVPQDAPATVSEPKSVSVTEPLRPEAPERPVPVAASEGDKVVPLRGYRRAMAKSMAAANEVPHFTFCEEIDMDRLVELRTRLQAAAAVAGGADVKVTYMPLIMKALSAALRDFPEVNATVNADATELTCRASHNIGVAMATPQGLVVPNVKNCQDLTVKQIAQEMQRLQGLAKAGRLPDHDLKGGTITVSNVGTIGGTYATPLINLPEVAIVALGKVQTLPRYRGGELRPVAVMQVSWSADHRVIDGASIASFCQAWKRYLEAPDTLLLHLR